VREATIALETAGLIELRTGGAAYVRPRRLGDISIPSDALDAMACGVWEQLEASMIFEVELAAEAAITAHRDAVRRIASLLDEPAADSVPQDLPAPATRAFHEAIAAASSNTFLASLASGLWAMRSGEAWKPHAGKLNSFDMDGPLLIERRRLVEALSKGASRQARTAMTRTHLRIREILLA
jgi:DNA-binding FadR family transcriptional regulator